MIMVTRFRFSIVDGIVLQAYEEEDGEWVSEELDSNESFVLDGEDVLKVSQEDGIQTVEERYVDPDKDGVYDRTDVDLEDDIFTTTVVGSSSGEYQFTIVDGVVTQVRRLKDGVWRLEDSDDNERYVVDGDSVLKIESDDESGTEVDVYVDSDRDGTYTKQRRQSFLGDDKFLVGSEGDDDRRGGRGKDSLYGRNGDDDLKGEGSADYLSGDGGDDEIDGGSGDDEIRGGIGRDRLKGGSGRDSLDGDEGDDDVNGGRGDDDIHGGSGVDRLRGAAGADQVRGGSDADKVFGNDGEDDLYGEQGDDDIAGGDDDDLLDGGKGEDDLKGQDGDDALAGGDDDDILTGGAGADRCSGGLGADRFVYRRLEDSGAGIDNRDHITDFNPTQGDILDLKPIDADTNRKGNQPFQFIGSDPFHGKSGELRFSNGVISADLDGDSDSDFEIAMPGLVGPFNASHLIL